MPRQVFTASGTFTPPEGVTSVSVLVVGGGGGGGRAGSGGAGGSAGRVRWETGVAVSGPVTVTIGSGGAGRTATTGAGSGGNSSFFGSLEAIGGGAGAGGGASVPTQGAYGGGGQGSTTGTVTGATGLIAYKGGNGASGGSMYSTSACGGGGGAGGNGGNATYVNDVSSTGGVGGIGIDAGSYHSLLSDIGWIGGGGGGATQTSAGATGVGGAGGQGGGGAGRADHETANGGNGTANTGGGGGGGSGSAQNGSSDGGNGGSGLVVVLYDAEESITVSASGLTAPTTRWVKPVLRVSWFDGTNWGAVLPTSSGHAVVPNIQEITAGVVIDSRLNTRPTTVYHDGWLGVLRGSPTQSRFSSFDTTDDYGSLVVDSTVPLTSANLDAGPISMCRAQNGSLWAAVAESGSVKVSRSTDNGATWGSAQTIISMTSTTGIPAITAVGTSVLLFVTENDAVGDYRHVRTIDQGAASYSLGFWASETLPALAGTATADDHAAIDVTSDGRVIVVAKTTVENTDPLIYVLARSTGGVWTQQAVLEIGPDADGYTRPALAITGQQAIIYYGSFGTPTDAYRRVASLSDLTTWTGRATYKTGADWSDSAAVPTHVNIAADTSNTFPVIMHNRTTGGIVVEWQAFPIEPRGVRYIDSGLTEYPSGGTSSNFKLTLPAGVLAGDILALNVTAAAANVTQVTLPQDTITLLPMSGAPDGLTISAGVYLWEVPSPKPVDITFTWTVARRGTIAWAAFRKEGNGAFVHSFSSSGWLDDGPTEKSASSVTTDSANAYVLGGVIQDSGSASITPPGGWTARTNANERDGHISTKGTQISPGATGDATFGVSGGQSHLVWQLALEESVPPVQAKLTSEPFPTFTGDIADGAAIVYDSASPADSVVLATNKDTGGGLYVLGLDGQIKSSLLLGAANSVDWRDFQGNSTWNNRILIATTDREANLIRYAWLDRTTKVLTAAGSTSLAWEPYGSCLYVHSDGKVYVFISQRGSDDESPRNMYQYELTRSGSTVSASAAVRTISLNSVVEGLAADDTTGYLFASEEDVGLYRYSAAPNGGSSRTTIDTVGAGNLVADVEDVAIARTPNGDKLLVSSQGDSSYHVYDMTTFEHEQRFILMRPNGSTRVGGTDGLDVYIGYLGPEFPNGLIVIHDGDKTPVSDLNFVDAAQVFGELSNSLTVKVRIGGVTVNVPTLSIKGQPPIVRGAVRINGETVPLI